jgi:hypothetical protein
MARASYEKVYLPTQLKKGVENSPGPGKYESI